MRGCVLLGEGWQHLIDLALADINQHVRIREPLHRPCLISLKSGHNAVQCLATIVLFQYFTVSHRRHPIVVELEPSSLVIRLDESEVVTAVEITRVDEYTMKLVDPW